VRDLPLHLALFALISFAIVLLSGMYSEPDDAKLVRALPRRFVVFVLGCTVVAGLVLLFEHTFARV
jgi:hypothetical protein